MSANAIRTAYRWQVEDYARGRSFSGSADDLRSAKRAAEAVIVDQGKARGSIAASITAPDGRGYNARHGRAGWISWEPRAVEVLA